MSYAGIPTPEIQDEFSYLLGADTFVHGRLANPAPSLAKFFESPGVLVVPTYASKYPPGQAMFLALGQKFFGSPFSGVLVGNMLMLFTFCVMLYAWLPSRWALATCVMVAFCLRPGMYWTNSYWGGSVAASGAALVLLGVGRYRKRPTPSAGASFAIGVLLLLWARPFEGGLFVVMVLIVFGPELWWNRRIGAFSVALSLFVIGAVWTCYDNKAVTGNPFRFPHLEYSHQYKLVPEFAILPLRPERAVSYSSPRLAALMGHDGLDAFNYKVTNKRWLRVLKGFVIVLWNFPFWLALLFTVLVPLAWRQSLYRRLAVVSGIVILGLAFETYHLLHYSAPVWAPLVLMTALWAEKAWNFRVVRFPVGRMLVLIALASPWIDAFAKQAVTQAISASHRSPSVGTPGWPKRREALIRRLLTVNGRQLVIVRYPSPDWNTSEEWVYDGADIDRQRIVFAHDFGDRENQALLNYYPDRTAWLVTFNPTTGEEQVAPYPTSQR